jgi:hypothetical protein
MVDDFATATRYLVGEMDTEERAEFEMRVACGGELSAIVVAAEDELLDRYLGGQADGFVRVQLAGRLAVDPGLRRRLILIGPLFERAGPLPSLATGRRWWWLTGSSR